MPIKNNDDVAHLLEATGGSVSPYREFESPSDHMSAPLIDAVFAKGPPEPAAETHRPLPLQAGTSPPDLLSEVFESAPRNAPPAHPYPAPSAPPAGGYPQAIVQPSPAGRTPFVAQMAAPPAPAAHGMSPPGLPRMAQPSTSLPQGVTVKRSLSDIRRIITKRAEDVPSAPPSDGLTGLFDRLAG
jgi:hypothetical protein